MATSQPSGQLRPLTLDDLETAKASILQELQSLGKLAADRLRAHLLRAAQLRQPVTSIPNSRAPASIHTPSLLPAPPLCPAEQPCNCPGPSASPLQPPLPSTSPATAAAAAPLLNRDTLEALFHQQIATDTQLPSRWEHELERRLQAHTPTPSATPFQSTGTNTTPLSSCPASPLLSQPWRRRSRLGYAEGSVAGWAAAAAGTAATGGTAPAAAANEPAEPSAAGFTNVPSDCNSGQSLCTPGSTPGSTDRSRGASSGGAGGSDAAASSSRTAPRPPRPVSGAPCRAQRGMWLVAEAQSQPESPGSGLLNGPVADGCGHIPAGNDDGSPLTVERPPRPVARAVVAAVTAAAGAPGGPTDGSSCASSNRSSPEPGSRRRQLPSQLVQEIVQQLALALSVGGPYSAGMAADGVVDGVGADGVAGASDGFFKGEIVRAEGAGSRQGRSSSLTEVSTRQDRVGRQDRRSPSPTVSPATGYSRPQVGEELAAAPLLGYSLSDPEPFLRMGCATAPACAQAQAMPFACSSSSDAAAVATQTAPITPMRTSRGVDSAAAAMDSAVATRISRNPSRVSMHGPTVAAAAAAPVSGGPSSGVASPGGSGSGGTSLTPSYRATSPFISTPPSSRSASGPATSYASPVLRGSGGFTPWRPEK